MDISKVDFYMLEALREAQEASFQDEVPVGCVIVGPHGEVLSRAHNLKEKLCDTTAHAELLAIREASNKIQNWRLLNCSIFVTLEPCPMCLSAILQARLSTLYFGAYDPKGGALSLGYNFPKDDRFNHRFGVVGGVNHYECSRLLSDYFKQKRKKSI